MILADNALFVGGKDQVTAIDAKTGKTLWSGKVTGRAKGLAASGGRLFVSTDRGTLHVFGPNSSAQVVKITEEIDNAPYPESREGKTVAQTAAHILAASGKKGYALVTDLENGRLAYELAKQSDLIVYAVSDNPEKVKQVRATLDKSPLLDSRLYVETWPTGAVPYSDYFANLIVAEKNRFRREDQRSGIPLSDAQTDRRRPRPGEIGGRGKNRRSRSTPRCRKMDAPIR